MIKQILFSFAIFVIAIQSNSSFAQCNGRYQTEIFSQVTKTADITYGSNVNASGSNQDLTMDIYEPSNDTETKRPLFVLAHGGSFIGGTKNDNDVVTICNSFAKRGYVTASYNYRLGFTNTPPSQSDAMSAVFRAVQDAKACIRWFWQTARNGNPYKIDTNQIFLGGSSAGAFIAIHYAYLNEPSELPANIDTTTLGGMHGNSGNPGYPEKIKAIVNLCGAIGNLSWIKPNDTPICSMHGTNDGTVPYGTHMLYLLNFIPIMPVSGSYSIDSFCHIIGTESDFYSFKNADHVPYAGNAAYMDTTLRFVSDFLYLHLECSTGIASLPSSSFKIYPNPATDQLTIDCGLQSPYNIRIYSADLKEMINIPLSYSNQTTIPISQLPAGIYGIECRNSAQVIRSKFIKLKN